MSWSVTDPMEEVKKARANPNIKSLDEEEVEVLKHFFTMTAQAEIMEYYDDIRAKMKALNVTYATVRGQTFNP